MLSKEPVVILDLVKTVLGALTAAGVALKPEHMNLILGIASAALMLLTAYTRSKVSPAKGSG